MTESLESLWLWGKLKAEKSQSTKTRRPALKKALWESPFSVRVKEKSTNCFKRNEDEKRAMQLLDKEMQRIKEEHRTDMANLRQKETEVKEEIALLDKELSALAWYQDLFDTANN
jgi:uncharacterized protein involved in exopolysaccharide biosynthesis